jgi:hypothetical protein
MQIEVSITSLTYWASAKPTVSHLRTPSWKPTEPLNPRIFIQHSSYPYFSSDKAKLVTNTSSGIRATLRWDAPSSPNGPLLGYLVHCWKDNVKKPDCVCSQDTTSSSSAGQNTCDIENLQPSASYQFAVQAYTDAGAGALSRKISSGTEYSNPLPKLFITSQDSLDILDIDKNHVEKLPLGYLAPASACFLYSDQTAFWLNDGNDLFMSKIGGSRPNKTRLLTLKDSESSMLTLDWIGRRLFWAGEETRPSNNDSFKYSIMTYDLSSNPGKSHPKVLIQSMTPIRAIAVNPFRSTLFWTTSRRSGLTTLMFTSDLDKGTSSRPFLSRDQDNCNCSNFTATGEPLSFDPTGHGSIMPQGLLFMDKTNIVLSDEFGCKCVSLAQNLRTENNVKISGDKNYIYWSSGGSLHASLKDSYGGASGVTSILSQNVREVQTFGEASQPYPDLNCLIPRELDPTEPLLFNHSSHSLLLHLPGAKTVNCTG